LHKSQRPQKIHKSQDETDRARSQSQWRHQDLLRGGAKTEIMSWGTHDGLRGRVQQLLND